MAVVVAVCVRRGSTTDLNFLHFYLIFSVRAHKNRDIIGFVWKFCSKNELKIEKQIQKFPREKKAIFYHYHQKSLSSACNTIYLSLRSFHVLVCVCVYLIKDIVRSFFFSPSNGITATNRKFSILVKAVATGVISWCKQQKASAKIDRKRWKRRKKEDEKEKLQTDENDNARTDLKFCNLKIIHPHTYAGVMHFARIWHFNMKSWIQSSAFYQKILCILFGLPPLAVSSPPHYKQQISIARYLERHNLI